MSDMKKSLLIIIIILCLSASLTLVPELVEATETDFPILTAMSSLSSSTDPSGFKVLSLEVKALTMLATNIYHSIYYSIDGQNKVSMSFEIIPDNGSFLQFHGTIIGEATLPILPNGFHTITIYVETTCANPLPFGDLLNPSETLNFNLESQPAIIPSITQTPLDTPTPSPSPSPSPSLTQTMIIPTPSPTLTPNPSSPTPSIEITPSPSPTQQPTLEPSQLATPPPHENSDLGNMTILIIVGLLALAVLVGVAFILGKLRNRKDG
jgi:hypothetical protein